MLTPSITKNDKVARWLIGIFSVIVFLVVVFLERFKLNVHLGFSPHVFAKANAVINALVALLLVLALLEIRLKNYALHRNMMLAALVLSSVFLISYIGHHLLAGETKFGDTNHDGLLSATELDLVGNMRYIYFIILGTHIFFATLILPFVLFTAYRGLTGEYSKHIRLARIIWPLWFYVAVTGPLVFWMIKPYYLYP